jgi:hypothetical protein
MEPIPPSPEQPQRNWWSKNAFWVVPLGCIGVVSIIGVFVITILFLVYGALRSSDPYKQALATANADTRVVRVLGAPITDRFFLRQEASTRADRQGGLNLRCQ